MFDEYRTDQTYGNYEEYIDKVCNLNTKNKFMFKFYETDSSNSRKDNPYKFELVQCVRKKPITESFKIP